MDLKQIDKAVKKICKKLQSIEDGLPDMLGQDWANEHYWISSSEHAGAENKNVEGTALQIQQLELIEQIFASSQVNFKLFINDLLKKINTAIEKIQALYPSGKQRSNTNANFTQAKFSLAQLPSILKSLKSWSKAKKVNASDIWAWRVVFISLDDANKVIKHSRHY